MLTSTLRNVGGSVMMVIPKSLLEGLGMTVNTRVNLSLDQGRLVIEPRLKPKYNLADLINQCEVNAPYRVGDSTWETIDPTGREFW